MKQFITIVLFLAVSFSNSFAAVSATKSDVQPQTVKIDGIDPTLLKNFSPNDLLTLTPSKIKQITGKKLTLFQSVGLKIAQNKLKKKLLHKEAGTSSDKKQMVAFLLCLLLGGLGIHRFYLGYTTIGIIQLLTLGGCGIWALIDLIQIIGNSLTTKDGQTLIPW